jgi:hypothetical protein
MPMKSTTWLGIAASGAALSVFAYWSAGLPQHEDVPASAEVQRSHSAAQPNPRKELPDGHPFAPVAGDGRAVRAELAALHERVETLADELALVRRQLAAAPRQMDSSAEAVRPHPTREEAEREVRARDAELQSAFNAERIDPQWAGGAAATLRQALGGDESSTIAVRSVECRSRTCRAEIGNEGNADINRFLSSLALRLADTFGTMATGRVDQGGASSTTVLYFSR